MEDYQRLEKYSLAPMKTNFPTLVNMKYGSTIRNAMNFKRIHSVQFKQTWNLIYLVRMTVLGTIYQSEEPQ